MHNQVIKINLRIIMIIIIIIKKKVYLIKTRYDTVIVIMHLMKASNLSSRAQMLYQLRRVNQNN